MGQIAVGLAGAAVGSMFGNPMLGFSVGMAIGGILFPQTNPIPQDRSIQGSDYGAAIPLVFGEWRLAGQMIWASPLIDPSGQTSGQYSGGGSGGPSTTNYTLDALFLICEGPVTLLKVWADSDLVADYTVPGGSFVGFCNAAMFDFHPGYSDPGTINTSQLPDSTVVAAQGASTTPAYTNRATLSVTGFPWSRYGHTPNFTFLVQQSVSPTLQSILTTLFERVGVPSGNIDFSAVSGVTVSGFLVPGRMDLATAIKPLQDAYFFDVIEVDGIVKASVRSSSPSFTLSPQWVGVATDAAPPENAIEPSRRPETELPLSIDVAYSSPGRDFQTASQTVRRFVTLSQNQESINFPLVMSDNTARQIGESRMYELWNQRTRYKITYTPDYLFIAPGDVGYLTVNGSTRTVRVLEQAMGMFGHIEATAVEHEPTIYTQIAPGDGYGAGSVTPGSGNLNGLVIDVNAPTDANVFDGGYEYALLGSVLGRSGNEWRGGIIKPQSPIYKCPDGSKIGSGEDAVFPNMSTFGVTSAALAAASADVVDTTSSLTVVLTSGALYSCSDADFLAGALNVALVGSEYIYFRDVTQVSTNVFTISHLIRGARGTEGAISGHASTENFVWINSNTYYWGLYAPYVVSPANTANFLGAENYTTSGNNITISGVPLTGNNLKCYAPCNIAASRDGSGNITLTWNRRSRFGGGNPWNVPLETKDTNGLLYEVYIVDVLISSVVVKSYTVTAQQGGTTYLTAPTLLISAADQNAMSGGLMSPITVNVYQLNASLPVNGGRGYANTVSV